ncbi:MAG: glycoside hydrolase family 31 protein [Dermabacter sp.]|nr:glycoside hydrolase family 31 protein [Dermabacter sp.]
MTSSTAASSPAPDHSAYERRGHQLVGRTWRLSVLTPSVVRLEYSPSGAFEDRPSTFVTHRDVACEEFTVRERPATAHGAPRAVIVETEKFRLTYDGREFSPTGLVLEVLGGITTWHSVWRYGQESSIPAHRQNAIEGREVPDPSGNFGGAARTLDEARGRIPLEPGINATSGFAVIDDSTSMLIGADDHLHPRPLEEGYRDLILFASGHDAAGALADFYALSSAPPLLPAFALGNWWSRYHPYTEASYLELMDRFEAEQIPLSVAVIDMDWHLVDVDPAYGSGWTGYTWNRDLFEDPARFQRALHERGMAVTLNVHPADGIQPFEEAYPRMARALGREADGTPIAFDVNDPDFMRAYFDVLHRGLEELGTDFWWVDWQQGQYSSIPGVDPLWVLNHEHFRDSERARGRGLTFSRYAGPGSHRYPVGFSGDSVIGWEALAFQPEFTAAAANIGYGWWSHDIGGHMGGVRDDELAARWVQFGVFSPIMRLHSSNSPFGGKEPWRFREPYRSSMMASLRRRHRLFPYLHAMNYRAAHNSRVLCEPMYFAYPGMTDAPGQYMFGSELLVAPIVSPAPADVPRGSVSVRLPEGRWVDLFTGRSYPGGRRMRVFRGIDEIPVFLKAGGFVPEIDTEAPGATLRIDVPTPPLAVSVAAGADGTFVLREEPHPASGGAEAWGADGWEETTFHLDTAAARITVEGPASHAGRSVRLRILGTATRTGGGIITAPLTLDADGRASFEDPALRTVGSPDTRAALEDLLNEAQVGYALKERTMAAFEAAPAGPGRAGATVSAVAAVGEIPDAVTGQVEPFNAPSAAFLAAVSEIVETDTPLDSNAPALSDDPSSTPA